MRLVSFVLLLALAACSSPKEGTYVYDLGSGGGTAPGTGSGPASGGAAGAPTSRPAGTTPASPGSGTSTPSSQGTFDVSLDKASAGVDLMASEKVTLTLTPSGGFAGMVTLAAAGLPADVAVTFDRTSIDLSAGPAMVLATITAASRALPSTASLSFTASAAARPSVTKSLALTVNARITVTITEAAITPSPVTLTLGSSPIAVRVHNADNVSHQIHADDAQRGFAHGNDIDPGADEADTQAGAPRTVKAKGTYDYYLHDNSGVRGKIVVQ